MENKFNGKAIYQPAGKAGEYAKWACNFYVGCSNACTYCFNKRWGWGEVPKLKKCFESEEHALWQYGYDNQGIYHYGTPREAYSALFDSIYGKGTWDSNPYVWVYDYKLIK